MKLLTTRKWILAGFVLISLSACSTTPTSETRFFSLTPLSESYTGVAQANQLSLGIGPVEIPGSLNRPQLIYRKNNNEILISEHNQWVGSMRDEIQNVLVERMVDVSGSQHIKHYPWPHKLWPEYQVRVRIKRLDGLPGTEVILDAHWDLLTDKGKQLLTSRKSHYKINLESEDYLIYVIAQQTALSNLADEIMQEIVLYQK